MKQVMQILYTGDATILEYNTGMIECQNCRFLGGLGGNSYLNGYAQLHDHVAEHRRAGHRVISHMAEPAPPPAPPPEPTRRIPWVHLLVDAAPERYSTTLDGKRYVCKLEPS